ncbi:MAG: FAD-dependent oxidoreductase [Thermoproteota archaeon]
MNEIDYAIVGGGVAGTYCAWRLKQKHRDKRRITLFEYSDRIGGRLLSLPPEKFNVVKCADGKTIEEKGGLDVVAELGGMRYLPGEHRIFEKVIDMLKLKSVDFPMGYGKDPNGENNIAYFRRTFLKIKELRDPQKIPFPNLSWTEKNLSPDELQYDIMNSFVPDHDKLKTLKDWANVEIFGKKLYQFGFWNLLYRILTPEAYVFLKYGSGYDTNVSNGNAAILLPTGEEFSPQRSTGDSKNSKPQTKFRTLENGLQELPQKLAEEFEKMGGDLKKNHRLDSIKKVNDGYELKFIITEKRIEKGRYITIDTNKEEHFTAKSVILAMPRTALEQIKWDQWKKNEFLKKNLRSVLNQPAMKILLVYDYAWWRSLRITFGRSITDLPIRQTLYFTSKQDAEGKAIRKKPALLLASYNDIETIPFWKGLSHTEDDSELFYGPEGYQATKEMVKEANEQIEEMHDFEEMLNPIAAAFFDWSVYPFGAGWHCWKPNYKFWEIEHRMCHPVENEKVYICGDAYSLAQGWAEGALETAEQVLTEHLDERLEKIISTEGKAKKKSITKEIKRRR